MAELRDSKPSDSKELTASDEREEGVRKPQEDNPLPAFARDFPNNPELRLLLVAFEQGRHDVVREGAPKLAESTDNPDVARAARELRSRIEADPLAIKLMIGIFALLTLLTSWVYFFHKH